MEDHTAIIKFATESAIETLDLAFCTMLNKIFVRNFFKAWHANVVPAKKACFFSLLILDEFHKFLYSHSRSLGILEVHIILYWGLCHIFVELCSERPKWIDNLPLSLSNSDQLNF